MNPSHAAAPSPTPLVPHTGPSRGRKLVWIVATNLVLFAACGLVAEVALRWCWTPRYWVHAQGWRVGSGLDAAGKKWWPDTTYVLESPEFAVRFTSNALGYRAHPGPPAPAGTDRIAFVGDSFTEAMQVETDQTFVASLEQALATGDRPLRCENFGVAATGVFEYWHRLIHDVIRPGAEPPRAVVLCLYPGNDFTDACPADGIDVNGQPLRDYYRPAGPAWHILTWLNTKSKLVHWAVQSIRQARNRPASAAATGGEPPWWTDPALATRHADRDDVRRIRSLVRAIAAECESRGVRLVVMVIGPAPAYRNLDGQSPLAAILAGWGLEVPVVDIAAGLGDRPDASRLLFPRDGHLTPEGHAEVARLAREPLARAIGLEPVAATP